MSEDLEAQLAELRADYARIVHEIPAAQEAVRKALHAYEISQAQMNGVIIKANAACGHGDGKPGVMSAPLYALIEQERKRYNDAGLQLTLARRRLEQLKWDLSCRGADIETLERLLRSPRTPVVQVMRTRERVQQAQDGADLDSIVFPSGRAA